MEIKMTDEQRDAMWRERLKQLAASGKTQKAWCQENGIAESTMRYWIRKLKPATETDKPGWIQVPSKTETDLQKSELTIIRSGVKINITEDADPELINRLIKAMVGI